MSEEQVEIVRREYLAFAARDWAALGTLWHPEIEYEVLMGAGTFRGLDQITQFFDAYAEMYADFRVEAEEIVDLGNHVLVVERLAGRGLMGRASLPGSTRPSLASSPSETTRSGSRRSIRLARKPSRRWGCRSRRCRRRTSTLLSERTS
jgi:hypothetical protein